MARSYKVTGNNAMYSRNEIVDEKQVLFQIEDWDFAQGDDETIILELRIKTGSKKNQTLRDFVSFAPDSKMNWKYKALRSAIGKPIAKEGEDVFDLIDLIDQYFIGDLVKSKDGRYQNIQYKRYDSDEIDVLYDEVAVSTDDDIIDEEGSEVVEDVVVEDDDLPF